MTRVSPIRPNWNGAKRRKLFVAVGQMAQMTKHIDPGAATTPAEQPPPEKEHHDIIFDTFPIWSDRDPTIRLGGAGQPVFDWLRNLVSDVEAVPQWVSPDHTVEYKFCQKATWRLPLSDEGQQGRLSPFGLDATGCGFRQ